MGRGSGFEMIPSADIIVLVSGSGLLLWLLKSLAHLLPALWYWLTVLYIRMRPIIHQLT